MLHKYLIQRGLRYYFRWRIPADLRVVLAQTELVLSLRTSNPIQAGIRAKVYIESIDALKAIREAYIAHDIDSSDYVTALKYCWFKLRAMARKNKTFKTEYILYGNVKFDYGSEEKDLEALKKAIDNGILPDPKDSLIPSTLNQNISTKFFSELFEEFMEHKLDVTIARREGRRPLPERAQKEHRMYFLTLKEIMSDLPISSIDRSAVKEALLTYKQLPQRNKGKYRNLPVAELLEMEIPDEDIVSNKTVEAVRKLLQGIFRYAIDIGYMTDSPARDLNLKLGVSTTFAAYPKNEVVLMLQAAAKATKSWQRWMPLLAAYTGARRTELVQLRKEDIKFDPDSNRHYILITDEAGDVKTENAIRQVPLHSVLIDSGFLEFVDAAEEKLFDDLKPQAVTAWFARFRDKLGIKQVDDYGNRKVFHSFRHTFITYSRGAGNSLESVQQVVGHEKTSAGTTDRYTHRLPVGDVLSVVDKISYS